MKRTATMVSLVEEYLAARRQMGFALEIAGEQLLAFARFADKAGHHGPVGFDLAVRWAQASSRHTRLTWARRLEVLRPPSIVRSLMWVPRLCLGAFSAPPIGGSFRISEMQAILDAPDGTTWCGHRDRVMFTVFYNTGGRVSEITGLRVADVVLDGCAAVRIHGKGRKDRSVPLWRTTVTEIRRWSARTHARSDQTLFPGWSGTRMSRPAVTARLQLAVQRGALVCPQLAQREVSPHTIRHSTAMHRLQAGVDITLIALWLGHENPTTTHMYVEADLAMKERALNAVQPPRTKQTRYQPTDRVLPFLETL